MTDVDKTTILQAKNGNLAAFENIVYRFEKPLYSYLYRLCGHGQTAEDLTQETFLKIYKNLKKIDPDGNFSSYIFTIATHVAYDFFRKKKHVQELFILDDPESDIETITEEHAYTIVEKIENSEFIEKALSQLKTEYKTVLLLFYKEDFSYETIAKTLHIPLNTVKTYLHRAKRALKEVLSKPAE